MAHLLETDLGTDLDLDSYKEIESRDSSPSQCNVKCSVQYNVAIEFGIWIRVRTRVIRMLYT